MSKVSIGVVALACFTVNSVSAIAEDLESIDKDRAVRMAEWLCGEAKKIQDPQVKFTPDAAKARGVHRPSEAGVLIVPRTDLREGETEQSADVTEETGAALGYLFSYRIVPVVNGQPVKSDKLRRVEFASDTGEEAEIYCLLLTVRQLPGDDWRLYAYGSDKKPLVDVPFAEAAGPGHQPLTVEIKRVEDTEGDLVVTVYDKYQATFKAQYQQD